MFKVVSNSLPRVFMKPVAGLMFPFPGKQIYNSYLCMCNSFIALVAEPTIVIMLGALTPLQYHHGGIWQSSACVYGSVFVEFMDMEISFIEQDELVKFQLVMLCAGRTSRLFRVCKLSESKSQAFIKWSGFSAEQDFWVWSKYSKFQKLDKRQGCSALHFYTDCFQCWFFCLFHSLISRSK